MRVVLGERTHHLMFFAIEALSRSRDARACCAVLAPYTMTSQGYKKIVVLIPCKNEMAGIAAVVQGLPYTQAAKLGYVLEPIVIDNNSDDHTGLVAQAVGATVLFEEEPGKGNAMRKGFAYIPLDADYVAMIDGDNTYRPEELLRLIEPLDAGFCDVVIGSRMVGKISDGAMNAFNRLGNWGFSFLVRILYNENVTDVLTGYWAWTRESILELAPHVKADGFAIEMEMITKLARLKRSVYSVPISYVARAGESNLRPVHDGFRILLMLLRNLHWQPRASIRSQDALQPVPHVQHTR